jgi:hypothetical protein
MLVLKPPRVKKFSGRQAKKSKCTINPGQTAAKVAQFAALASARSVRRSLGAWLSGAAGGLDAACWSGVALSVLKLAM